jgi:Protein kinase domain
VVSADDHGAADGSIVSLAAGSRIAGYRLEERIGQGGMAVVFRAHDERLGRTVALKILAPTLAGDTEFQRRFISESRAAARIDDPHIVPVFAAGEEAGLLFIAMRYVAGGDAQSLLNREDPLPPGRVAAIISPVASALDAGVRPSALPFRSQGHAGGGTSVSRDRLARGPGRRSARPARGRRSGRAEPRPGHRRRARHRSEHPRHTGRHHGRRPAPRRRRQPPGAAAGAAASAATAPYRDSCVRHGGGSRPGRGTPARKPGSPLTVPISLKSALPAVTGDVYVVYRGGQHANAEVYGEIKKAANGEVAELYAQQFPYRNAPTRVGSVILHPAGTTARYEFQVTPTLATRYRVELFQSSTSSTPFATSGIATVYVAIGASTGSTPACGSPVCHESLQTTYTSPPSVLQTEMSKPLYMYFGLNLAPTKTPPTPKWLSLGAGHGLVIGSQRISADQFVETVTFSFTVGNDAYDWAWTTCLKDTEAEDGIGLPGHHGCGDQRVLYSANYLG